jgi:hypothetical protein
VFDFWFGLIHKVVLIGHGAVPYETSEPKSVIEFVRAELLGEDHFHRLLRGSSLTLVGMIEQPSRLHIDLHEYCWHNETLPLLTARAAMNGQRRQF